MSDEGKDYRLVMDVPGARKDDIEIKPGPVPGTLDVRIQGKEIARSQHLLRGERAPGRPRYQRVVPVAWDADVAKAKVSVSNGVLTIDVPKQNDATNAKK